MAEDQEIIRELAKRYTEIVFSDACRKRPGEYRRLNSLQVVRPPVLVFEVPWGELAQQEELRLQCQDARCRDLEWYLRSNLYQWKYFQGDYTLRPYFCSPIAVRHSGIGVDCRYAPEEKGVEAHKFLDVLPDEEALAQVRLPEIWVDREETERAYAFHQSVFRDDMPVKKTGIHLYFSSWDVLSSLRGVDQCLIDLYDRPEFSHQLMETFTKIHEHEIEQYVKWNVLDGDPYYLHCTPACTDDLPQKDVENEQVEAKDVWCRCMAQIFGMVSPDMLDEFDLQYTKRLFDRCGLSYYGCCEPLHNKIDKLRQFRNLRRISITPWADVDVAADQIQGDYVLSYKPNPAFVAGETFDPAPVAAEIRKVLEACRRNGTPCEFVLKDITTVRGKVERLTQWVETANSVIDEFF